MLIMGGLGETPLCEDAAPNLSGAFAMLPSDDQPEVSVLLSGDASEVPEGAAAAAMAILDGVPQSLIITRVGGTLAAFHNVCPHAGRPLDWAPGQFLIDQGRLLCAAHGAAFELGSGVCVSGPCKGAALTRLLPCWRLKTAS